MQHWNITAWNSLISKLLSLLKSLIVQRCIQFFAEFLNILAHFIVNFELVCGHRFQMEVNVGLRKRIIILIFALNLGLGVYSLCLSINFSNFSLDFIFIFLTGKNLCNFSIFFRMSMRFLWGLL